MLPRLCKARRSEGCPSATTDSYPESLEQWFIAHSPLHPVAALPDIGYLIIHGEKDKAVSKQHHSDKLVAAMRRRKLRVNYIEVPGMGHSGLLSMDMIHRGIDFVTAGMCHR